LQSLRQVIVFLIGFFQAALPEMQLTIPLWVI
jgi:hypothetical protein